MGYFIPRVMESGYLKSVKNGVQFFPIRNTHNNNSEQTHDETLLRVRERDATRYVALIREDYDGERCNSPPSGAVTSRLHYCQRRFIETAGPGVRETSRQLIGD
ncbi:unnamed protein product, partial [Iphiclides podalirius]